MQALLLGLSFESKKFSALRSSSVTLMLTGFYMLTYVVVTASSWLHELKERHISSMAGSQHSILPLK